MASVGGYWAEEEQYQVWQRAMQRLCSRGPGTGTVWGILQRYPETLLLYALGLGAVEAGRLRFIGHLLGTPIHREHQEDKPAVGILPPSCWFSDLPQGQQVMQHLAGMDNRRVPLNDWIHETLRPLSARIIPDANRYTLAFDKLEILMALSCAHQNDEWAEWYWAPLGAFVHRSENRKRIIQEITESLSTKESESPFVTCGIFGETVEDCEKGMAALVLDRRLR